MYRSFLLLTAAFVASGAPAEAQDFGPSSPGNIETVTVTAEHLAEARSGIQTQLGASTYTITADDIKAEPGGDNTLQRGNREIGSAEEDESHGCLRPIRRLWRVS